MNFDVLGKKKDLLAVSNTPAPSLIDEEILIEKRRFILPLIEANETMKIFDMLGRDDWIAEHEGIIAKYFFISSEPSLCQEQGAPFLAPEVLNCDGFGDF